MSDLSNVLSERRDRYYSRMGQLNPNVVSRLVPNVVWPSSTLGRMKIVRQAESVTLFTDGLSDPYDSDLHEDPPEAPLDFELSLHVFARDASAATDEALAASAWPSALYAIADAMVADWVDLKGLLKKFRVITWGAPPWSAASGALAGEEDRSGHRPAPLHERPLR